MALRLALQAPEQVAGIAIAGASLQAPEDSSCPEQGAVPLLVVQGEKDPIHPINGGKVTLFGSATEAECSPRSIPRRRLRSDSV
jgi:polyhydroxybutyrate depolymerase